MLASSCGKSGEESVYTDLTKYPIERIGGDTPDIGYCYSKPNFVVYAHVSDQLYISDDYGVNTVRRPSGVQNTMGVAVSADDTDNIVVYGFGGVPQFTRDGGRTWSASAGATENIMTAKWDRKSILEPDGKDGKVFYY